MDKIFDPYYSTKDTYSQKGLGLGLAVCYSVIKRHDGLITVDSHPGEGTTFNIYLPAVKCG
jgi:signal transduction histidine kinase